MICQSLYANTVRVMADSFSHVLHHLILFALKEAAATRPIKEELRLAMNEDLLN